MKQTNLVYYSVSFDECIHLCIPNPYQDLELLHLRHSPPLLISSQSLSLPTQRQSLCLFLHSRLVPPVPELHVNGIIRFVLFSVRLPFSIMLLRFPSSNCVYSELVPFFIVNQCSILCIHHSMFFHSPIDGYLAYMQEENCQGRCMVPF